MHESIRSSFLYFISGVLASTGVNLVTGIVGRPDLLKITIILAPPWILASISMAICASYWSSVGRKADRIENYNLSNEEDNALRKEELTSLINKANFWIFLSFLFIIIAILLILFAK